MYIAIAAMVIDHAAAIFAPEFMLGRLVGRLAFPMFALLIAYNITSRGVAPSKYAARLFIWGAVSIIPYYLAFGLVPWANIMFTLLLGVMLADSDLGRWRWLALVAAPFLEYGLAGVLLIPSAAFALRASPGAAPVAWALVLGLTASVNGPNLVFAAAGLFPLALLALALSRSSYRLGWFPRWRGLGYWFYPAHLAAFGVAGRVL